MIKPDAWVDAPSTHVRYVAPGEPMGVDEGAHDDITNRGALILEQLDKTIIIEGDKRELRAFVNRVLSSAP